MFSASAHESPQRAARQPHPPSVHTAAPTAAAATAAATGAAVARAHARACARAAVRPAARPGAGVARHGRHDAHLLEDVLGLRLPLRVMGDHERRLPAQRRVAHAPGAEVVVKHAAQPGLLGPADEAQLVERGGEVEDLAFLVRRRAVQLQVLHMRVTVADVAAHRPQRRRHAQAHYEVGVQPVDELQVHCERVRIVKQT